MPQHVLKFSQLGTLRVFEVVLELTKHVDDVILGALRFQRGTLLVNHMGKLILNNFIYHLLQLALLSQKVNVDIIVFFACYELSLGQFFYELVSLVEVLNQNLKGFDPHLVGAFIVKNVPHQEQIKGDFSIHHCFVTLDVFVLVLFSRVLPHHDLVETTLELVLVLAHVLVAELKVVVELVQLEQILELNVQIDAVVRHHERVQVALLEVSEKNQELLHLQVQPVTSQFLHDLQDLDLNGAESVGHLASVFLLDAQVLDDPQKDVEP